MCFLSILLSEQSFISELTAVFFFNIPDNDVVNDDEFVNNRVYAVHQPVHSRNMYCYARFSLTLCLVVSLCLALTHTLFSFMLYKAI